MTRGALAKKSLGQNFLIDANILKKIVRACAPQADECLLEIGSGSGQLTRFLAQTPAKKIYAAEIDPRLVKILVEEFKGDPRVKILAGDILDMDLPRILARASSLKVIGNIPYYITTPILERVLALKSRVSEAYFTVQEEFARRMVASPGSKEYGSFSCFLQYQAEAKIIFNIKKNCFRPVPKVDSCLLRLKMRPWPGAKPRDETIFLRILRAAFNQRRKTLRNSLKEIVPPQVLTTHLASRNLSIDTRPERLSLEDFILLSNALIATDKKS